LNIARWCSGASWRSRAGCWWRCANGTAGQSELRRAGVGERADAPLLEVLEPCSRVEFGVDGVDVPWELGSTWRLLDLDEDDANDRPWVRDLSGVGGLPSDGEEVAVVLEVELLEVDRGLLALTNHELVAVAEGGGQERN